MSDVLMQECEHCGKIIFGVGNLKKHMKKCKEQLCSQCSKKEDCKFTFWSIPCPIKKNKVMRIVGIILTCLICLLSLVFLGYKIPKEKTNMETLLLVLLFIIANVSGLVCLILIGLSIK